MVPSFHHPMSKRTKGAGSLITDFIPSGPGSDPPRPSSLESSGRKEVMKKVIYDWERSRIIQSLSVGFPRLVPSNEKVR